MHAQNDDRLSAVELEMLISRVHYDPEAKRILNEYFELQMSYMRKLWKLVNEANDVQTGVKSE